MKILLATCLSLFFAYSLDVRAQDDKDNKDDKKKDKFTLQEIIDEVQTALKLTQTQLRDLELPKLNSVDLEFESAFTSSGGGGAKFIIFAFGKNIEKENVHTISYTLTPPQPGEGIKVAARKGMSEQLVDAITGAAKAMKEVKLTNDPPLEFSKLVVELKFVVTTTNEAGLEFEITPIPIGLEIGGALEKSATHKIVVTYENS